MVIESVVICLDNSDFMRNEDFKPSRILAQQEVVDLMIQRRLRSNPEAHVSTITFSNNHVLTNLTTSESKLMKDLRTVEIGGSNHFLQGLKVAQLVLKHRPVKTHKCRVIAFVGSPVDVLVDDVLLVGKRFKKENLAVDVVKFGEEQNGAIEIEKLVHMLNGNSREGNNRFVHVPTGVSLCDFLVSTNMLGIVTAGLSNTRDEEDDELRMALEISLRESGGGGRSQQPRTPPNGIQDGNALSEDEQLALALQLSLQDTERIDSPARSQRSEKPPDRPDSQGRDNNCDEYPGKKNQVPFHENPRQNSFPRRTVQKEGNTSNISSNNISSTQQDNTVRKTSDIANQKARRYSHTSPNANNKYINDNTSTASRNITGNSNGNIRGAKVNGRTNAKSKGLNLSQHSENAKASETNHNGVGKMNNTKKNSSSITRNKLNRSSSSGSNDENADKNQAPSRFSKK